MRNVSLKEALIKLLKSERREMCLHEIYSRIGDFYSITNFQNQPDPKYPYATRLEHAIRSHLAKLKREGLIISTKRTYYKINGVLEDEKTKLRCTPT